MLARMPRWVWRLAVWLICLPVGIAWIAQPICARQAGAWYRGDAHLTAVHVNGLENWLKRDLSVADFSTGSAKFDGEWLFGTYMMAGMAMGQAAIATPEQRERYLALMAACIDGIRSEPVRAFDQTAWNGQDPLDAIHVPGAGAHAAYLGYFNLVLSLHRLLDSNSEFAQLNDDITAHLVRHVRDSPYALIETYPGETYPVDNCAVIASIVLHGRATDTDYSDLLNEWRRRLREYWIDPETGLLYQAVDGMRGHAVDDPRGSGTCLGLYFLSFAAVQVTRDLFEAMKRELADSVLRFGVVHEYPAHIAGGYGDIDSGPVVFGIGFSATGFALAGARVHGDRALFARLYATAHLFGAPVARGDRRQWLTGGPLGDAIMLAVLTAPQGGVYESVGDDH